jgi:hypothetical protein
MPKTKLIMLSAMYENGGNTTHRFLDGHPNLWVYPFESQPGTKYVNDHLSSMFPLKYRWPVFPGHFDAEQIYQSIIDEECKVRTKTPFVSKFRKSPFDLNDKDRLKIFKQILKGKDLTRKNIMLAFFQSTFEAWKDYNASGKESTYVGYSPIIGVDGAQIIEDMRGQGAVLHVVRNPFSAYADTKKRAVPLSIEHYITGWVLNQYYAILNAQKYPDKFIIIRFEDLVDDPKNALTKTLKPLGIPANKSMTEPTWNRQEMPEVYPWGTIRIPTPEMNLKTAQELNKKEVEEIYLRTELYLKHFNYLKLYKKI